MGWAWADKDISKHQPEILRTILAEQKNVNQYFNMLIVIRTRLLLSNLMMLHAVENRDQLKSKLLLKEWNTAFPTPKLMKQYDRHYLKCLSNLSFEYNHSFQPTLKAEELGKCKCCPRFYFISKAGRSRNLRIFHHWQKSTHPKDIKNAQFAVKCFQAHHVSITIKNSKAQ